MGSITCEPKVLADALAAVKAAVSTKSAIQALSGVRITSDRNGVTLTAVNWDLFIRRELPVLGEVGNAVVAIDELDVCVPHALLVKAAKAAFARHESVTLEQVSEVELHARSGNRKIELQTLRLQDFPEFPNMGGFTLVSEVNGDALASAIEHVAKFASQDDTRPLLTGVRVENENGKLALVATDSYRLIHKKLDIPAWAGGYTVPAKGLTAAAKLMRKAENVELRAYEGYGGPVNPSGYAIATWPGTVVAMRLIDGQYPNYQQLIPDTWPNQVTMPLSSLREAVSVGREFTLKNAPIRFYVNGVVKLHGHTPDVGGFEEILPDASVTWEPGRADHELEIGFNPDFLYQAAQSIEGENVVVNLISPLRPALLHNSEDDSERHLLMPIRLNV